MKRKDDAISPVVGVMLMLVVVIIMAAVVSAFASNVASNTESAPIAQIRYVGVIEGDISNASGYVGEVGLVFEHKGGEEISLHNLQIGFKENIRTGGEEAVISYADSPITSLQGSSVRGESRLNSGITYRMKKIGVTGTAVQITTQGNSIIKPGERFIVYTDRIMMASSSAYDKFYVGADRGGGALYSEGTFELGPKTSFSLIDLNSGGVIASGDLQGSVLDADLW